MRASKLRNLLEVVALATLVLALSTGCEDGTGLPDDVGSAGDADLEAALEFIRVGNGLPSLGAVLLRGSQVVETGAVGLRAEGSAEPVTTGDRWHLGSLTKAMTATVAARLVEQGVTSWSTTVESVFPDLVGGIRSEYLSASLDELLYHTSGLPDDVTRVPLWPSLRSDTSSLVSSAAAGPPSCFRWNPRCHAERTCTPTRATSWPARCSRR